jgi:polar amino acid transport system substrate-binding protein
MPTGKLHSYRPFALALFCCLISLAALVAASQVEAHPSATPHFAIASQDAPLKIATMAIEPFVFQQGGQQGDQLRGYDVDVWEQVASRLGVQYEWVFFSSVDEVLESVQENRVEAGMSAISMIPERDQKLDFSYPYFDSGLQIMVRQRPSLNFFEGIRLVVTPLLVEVVLIGLLAGLLMAHVVWLVERRSNPEFQHGYLQGVWDGLWWLVQIIASGTYRDSNTRSVTRRLITVMFWITGVALLGVFNATLVSALTVHQLTSPIGSVSDLPGYRIATVSGTTAADFLDDHNLEYTAVTKIDEAYLLLLDKQVDAIVFDAPVLLYYAAHEGGGKVAVVGQMFQLEKYGIALPTSSPLRKQINSAILQMYQDGTIETLQQKWFGNP